MRAAWPGLNRLERQEVVAQPCVVLWLLLLGIKSSPGLALRKGLHEEDLAVRRVSYLELAHGPGCLNRPAWAGQLCDSVPLNLQIPVFPKTTNSDRLLPLYWLLPVSVGQEAIRFDHVRRPTTGHPVTRDEQQHDLAAARAYLMLDGARLAVLAPFAAGDASCEVGVIENPARLVVDEF